MTVIISKVYHDSGSDDVLNNIIKFLILFHTHNTCEMKNNNKLLVACYHDILVSIVVIIIVVGG